MLSPNGRYLAVIVPAGGRSGLGVVDLETRTPATVTSAAAGDVLRVEWLDDLRMVAVVGDLRRGTGEPPQESGIVAIDRDGGNLRVVASGTGRMTTGSSVPDRGFRRPWTVSLVRALPGTKEILLTAFERSSESLDLYRYDTATGRRTLVSFESPGDVTRWIVDFDGIPRAVVADDPRHDASAWYVRKSAQDAWHAVDTAKLGRLASTPLQFDPDGRILYVATRRDGDRSAIWEYHVDTGAWRGPVARHPERDLDATTARFVADYAGRRLPGLRYVDDRPTLLWFDREYAAIQTSVDAALPDTVNALERRGNRWVVVAASDRNPGEAWLLDAATMKMEKLFAYAPWIDPSAMARTAWVRYRARDGLVIPALLTRPATSAAGPLPLVVLIHGGPHVPAGAWGFDPEVQFLASRGYAVLQPQFRGTRGFGWKLLSSGYRQWGDTMQDDLADGVDWAVAGGIADPRRVCYYGASYGGYAALWGAIRDAVRIRCAIAAAAVSSLDYLFDSAETDLSFVASRTTLMTEQIGDPATERERFRRVSPLAHAADAGVPILLAYTRVPLAHGTDFRAALDRAQKPYEWVVYPDEGHGLTRDANVVDFYTRVERFLARHLGTGTAAANAIPADPAQLPR